MRWVRDIPRPFWIMWGVTAALDLVACLCSWIPAHHHHVSLSSALFHGLRRFSDLLDSPTDWPLWHVGIFFG